MRDWHAEPYGREAYMSPKTETEIVREAEKTPRLFQNGRHSIVHIHRDEALPSAAGPTI
jgi:hypothetical protein